MIAAIAQTARRSDDSARLVHRSQSGPAHPRPLRVLAAALMLGALMFPGQCRAGGLVLSAPDITAAPGSSGSFLVLIADTDSSGSPGYNVATDTFELTLTGSPGVTFTGATIPTSGTTPYIYAVSAASELGLPLYTELTNPFPTADFTAADSGYVVPGGYPGYTTLNPGDVYALGLVSYTVSPDATAGTVPIDFGANTSLVDNTPPPTGPLSIPFTTLDGSITIMTVPEPAAWALALTGLAIVALFRAAHRRS